MYDIIHMMHVYKYGTTILIHMMRMCMMYDIIHMMHVYKYGTTILLHMMWP